MRGPERLTPGPTRIAIFAITLATVVACGSAQTQNPESTPIPSPSSEVAGTSFQKALQKAKMLSANRQVSFVIVSAQGNVFPEQLVVKKNIQYVVWIGEGNALTIEFKGTSPHFNVQCAGPICWMDPPNVLSPEDDAFPYKGSITVGTTTTPFDPRLEVVK